MEHVRAELPRTATLNANLMAEGCSDKQQNKLRPRTSQIETKHEPVVPAAAASALGAGGPLALVTAKRRPNMTSPAGSISGLADGAGRSGTSPAGSTRRRCWQRQCPGVSAPGAKRPMGHRLAQPVQGPQPTRIENGSTRSSALATVPRQLPRASSARSLLWVAGRIRPSARSRNPGEGMGTLAPRGGGRGPHSMACRDAGRSMMLSRRITSLA